MEGTYRKDRDQQLDLPASLPPIPAWLSSDEKSRGHWDRIGQQLLSHDLITGVDGELLALLVEAILEYQAATAEIGKDGLTSMTDKGYSYVTPAVAIRTAAWKKIGWCLRQFGMTPSARAGMKVVPHGKDSDEFEEILKKLHQKISARSEAGGRPAAGSKSKRSGRRS